MIEGFNINGLNARRYIVSLTCRHLAQDSYSALRGLPSPNISGNTQREETIEYPEFIRSKTCPQRISNMANYMQMPAKDGRDKSQGLSKGAIIKRNSAVIIIKLCCVPTSVEYAV